MVNDYREYNLTNGHKEEREQHGRPFEFSRPDFSEHFGFAFNFLLGLKIAFIA
jgi:hypothetical protein